MPSRMVHIRHQELCTSSRCRDVLNVILLLNSIVPGDVFPSCPSSSWFCYDRGLCQITSNKQGATLLGNTRVDTGVCPYRRIQGTLHTRGRISPPKFLDTTEGVNFERRVPQKPSTRSNQSRCARESRLKLFILWDAIYPVNYGTGRDTTEHLSDPSYCTVGRVYSTYCCKNSITHIVSHLFRVDSEWTTRRPTLSQG